MLVIRLRRLNLPTNIPLHFVAVRQMAAEGQFDIMVSDMEEKVWNLMQKKMATIRIRTMLEYHNLVQDGSHESLHRSRKNTIMQVFQGLLN